MDTGAPFLFVGNGPYANRGCEAIAKSSIRLIREFFPDVPIINGSECAHYDQVDETERDVNHKSCRYFPGRFSKMWLSYSIYRRTRLLIDLSSAGHFVRTWAPGSRAVLSMGGDLYGLSMGEDCLIQYLFLGQSAFKVRKPFVVWGATIGRIESDRDLRNRVMEHFKRCSLILVRDPTSYDYLNEHGVRDNVRLVADPAFLLEPAEPSVPIGTHEPLEETIGLNLIASWGRRQDVRSFGEMVKFGADCAEAIIRATHRPILLVPHVVAYPPEVCPDNDTVYLSLVQESLMARGLCVARLPSSLRSWEIKWVLARLRAHVGARFHSTIASMGSGTPTVPIIFSDKGPALSKFLLGHTDFLLNCERLTPGCLAERVTALLVAEQEVRDTLSQRLPYVRSLAHAAGGYLKEVVS